MTRRYQAGDVLRFTRPDSDLVGRTGIVLRASPRMASGVVLSFDLLLVAFGETLVETDPWSVELVDPADRQLALPLTAD